MDSTIKTLPIVRKAPGLCLLVLCLAISSCSTQPIAKLSSTVNYEGLAEVSRPHFDVAQLRPDTNFGNYHGVIVRAPELAFRMPDRSQTQFPLKEEQKQRFQTTLADAFSLEFSQLQNLDLTDKPGPGVLALTVRVENITVTVPPGRGPQLGFALVAVGEATLVIELHDAQSGQVLGRGVDTRAVQGAATRQGSEMVTRWEDVEKLCTRWASMARTRLDVLIDQG